MTLTPRAIEARAANAAGSAANAAPSAPATADAGERSRQRCAGAVHQFSPRLNHSTVLRPLRCVKSFPNLPAI